MRKLTQILISILATILILILIYPSLGCECCSECCDPEKEESCFLPGTLITLADGSQIPIEYVEVGDTILSVDENLNLIPAKVLEVESPMRDDYYIVTLANNVQLKVTDEHPLYMKSADYEGWGAIKPEKAIKDSGIKTNAIKVGDYLLNQDKEWIEVLSMEHIEKKTQTFNLKTIEKTNTFFAEGFLAHNKGETPPYPQQPQPQQPAPRQPTSN